MDMENQLERELAAERGELLEVEEEEDEIDEEAEEIEALRKKEKEVIDEKDEDELEAEGSDEFSGTRPGLSKVRSLPSNFIYNPPAEREKTTDGIAS